MLTERYLSLFEAELKKRGLTVGARMKTKLLEDDLIALGVSERPHDRITAIKSGFDAYIAKPVMQEELLAVLEGSFRSKKRN